MKAILANKVDSKASPPTPLTQEESASMKIAATQHYDVLIKINFNVGSVLPKGILDVYNDFVAAMKKFFHLYSVVLDRFTEQD